MHISLKNDRWQETLTYVALWTALFAAPVLSLYVRTAGNAYMTFDWQEVMLVWRQLVLFLIVFLLHNYLLAPLLVYKQKRLLYFSSVGVLIVAFSLVQCSIKPVAADHRPGSLAAKHEPAPHIRHGDDDALGRMRHGDDDASGRMRHGDDDMPDMFGPDDKPVPPEAFDDHRPEPSDADGKPLAPMHRHVPQLLMGQHDIIAIIIVVLMLGMNLGVKLYFRQRADQRRLSLLEHENLEQQMEYLKYQINPHFLMNTLNNIHALVDIDPEKSKDTILELSKMLRFVLYEGSKATVPLDREVAFLRNYITLMSLRYTDKVKINVDIPDNLPPAEIPPLMFITFVENAFKHGVSYRRQSFIDIRMRIDGENGRLAFECANSKKPDGEDKQGGVGLKNVKQRLELIYGKNFTLNINPEDDRYNILLEIPLENNKQQPT